MKRSRNTARGNQLEGLLLSATLILMTSLASTATAGIHTWDVVEVFSNADGTIQYIELFDFGLSGGEVGVGNGSLSSTLQSHSWSNGAVTGPTNGKSYLIATAGFAALPGAPVPDVIIPAGKVPFFDVSGDTVTFQSGDSFAFGPVPTNGTDSLDESTGVGPNTPKNYAGVQGSVNAAPAVPSGSLPTIALMVALLMALGMTTLQRLRHRASNLDT